MPYDNPEPGESWYIGGDLEFGARVVIIQNFGDTVRVRYADQILDLPLSELHQYFEPLGGRPVHRLTQWEHLKKSL